MSPEGLNVAKGTDAVARDLATLREAIPAQHVSVGMMVVWATGGTPGAKWRLCDGTALARLDYPELWDAIGTTHGVGDGARTFNLPSVAGPVASSSYWIYVAR